MCFCTDDLVVICSRSVRSSSLLRRKVESIARWDHSYYSGAEGSTFTFTCTVSDVALFDVVRIAKREFHINDVVVISDKAWLKPPFSTSGRYNLQYSTIDGAAIVTLTIRNVEDGDSGVYTCGLHDNLDSTQHAEMGVKVGCFDKHVHYRGPVINDCNLVTKTAKECQYACQQDLECTDFQLITEKFLDPGRHGQCCFKKDVVERLVDTRYHGLISGPKFCPDYVV